jgi:hypothetical protein
MLGSPKEINSIKNVMGVDFAQVVLINPVVYEPPISDPIIDNQSNMYMPIKALNTFARDWKIQARVASKSEKRTTNKGGYLLKIGLVDMYGT